MGHPRGAELAHHRFLLSLLMVFIAAAGIASGCFITNCPPGGKRSSPDFGRLPLRQCARCGFGGRCFGPSICCSPAVGCLLSDKTNTNAAFRPCAIEAVLPIACENGGKPCGAGTGGRCAAKGVCCDSASCSADSSCISLAEKSDSEHRERAFTNSREDLAAVKTYSDGYGGLDANVLNL